MRIAALTSALTALCVAFSPVVAGTVSAEFHMVQGKRHASHGQFGPALRAFAAALDRYREDGDARGQAKASLNRGKAYLSLGKPDDAVAALQDALRIAGDARDAFLPSRIRVVLGQAFLFANRTADARALLERSAVRGSAGNRATSLNGLGTLLASEGNTTQAKQCFRDSRSKALEAGNTLLAAVALINHARADFSGSQRAHAMAALETAVAEVLEESDSHGKAVALISIGRLYAREASHPAPLLAYKAYESAIESAQAIGDTRARSYALGYLGELYAVRGRDEDALNVSRRAAFFAQQANALDPLYRWEWQIGRTLRASGRIEEAIRAYRRAVASVQRVRHGLSARFQREQRSFRQELGPLFYELADLLLQRSAQAEHNRAAEDYLRQARQTVETLKGAELEDYFQDDCVASLKSRTEGVDRLAEQTAALYPVVLRDRTELLLSLPDGLRRYAVPVGDERFTREVRLFRRTLVKRTSHDYLPHAKQLYDWLIRPVQTELDRHVIKTLVVVPDGALQTVPLSALHDGERFLIEIYAVATTPGLTLTDPRPIVRQDLNVLLGGLSDSVQGFSELPHVSEELRQISDLYGGTVLKNRDFSVAQIGETLGNTPYSVVHIASHGRFESDVRGSFLLTYNDKLTMNELEAFLAPTSFRQKPVELLTLSACQTAAGDDRAALGLAGIAIKAGARSALATLWAVNDRASAVLVSGFYAHLRDPAVSKATALQRAQLQLLTNSEYRRRYRHPAYWSPFLLIGNWL